MRAVAQTITLGAASWLVRPLTLAQVQAIEPLLFGAGASTGSVAAAVAIVRVALSRDHAAAATDLDGIEAGAPELAAAAAAVLRLGGFLPNEGAASGEAGADPATAAAPSTGPRSTAG